VAADIFVHPLALCESAAVGAGTRIWAFAHVMKGAVVGRECNIGEHAFVEAGARIGDRVTIKNQAMVWDGVEIGDDVFVGPGACFTNDRVPRSPRMPLPAVARRYRGRQWLETSRVGRGASLGARSVVLAGVTIGAYAMVAAGAVVTRKVPAHALMAGTPARQAGWVCRCGARLLKMGGPVWRCPRCRESFEEQTVEGCTSLAQSC
jgi:acetyltransferase-like isoleucine patch superfamily enzyme